MLGLDLALSLILVFVSSVFTSVQKGSYFEGRRVLIVAGNFTLDGERLNIAQFDVHSGIWSNKYQAEVYLFGEDNGAIRDIAVNYTNSFDYMYTVGLFDTVSKTSQIQLCSVARFDGISFEKVGEGLCYRGVDTAFIQIRTVVLGYDGDLFVGGNFATRVWDGHHFVYVYHVARYDAHSFSWLPLTGGGELRSTSQEDTRVNSLAWDEHRNLLYIGGKFHAVDNAGIPPGLAVWSPVEGLLPFPGGGVTLKDGQPGEVQALILEPKSRSLVVTGIFSFINDVECAGAAMWNGILRQWKCLVVSDISFSTITTVTLDNSMLYMAGKVTSQSSWKQQGQSTDYNIARLNIQGYIEECLETIENMEITGRSENITADSTNVTVPDSGGARRLRIQYSTQMPSHHHVSRDGHSTKKIKQPRSRHLSASTQPPRTVTEQVEDWFAPHRQQATSNDSIVLKHLLSPTPLPTPAVRAWSLEWEWLPNFSGTNGPVLKLVPGRIAFENSLLISGQFTNYPPLLKWDEEMVIGNDGLHHVGNTSVLGGRHELEGIISSMAEVFLPFETVNPNDPPAPKPYSQDYTFVVLLACVGVGVLMGLGFTISCLNKWTLPVPPEGGSDYYDVDETGSHHSGMSAFSLKTLCDGQGSATVDFREAFERAMKTRHLPTYEGMVIINPKEILLSRIIGEGSFGRVWSGQWRNNAVAVKEFVFAQAAIAGGSLQRNNIIEEIVGEAGVMACLRHPKILQLYGCSLTMQAIWIVSELCIRGSLKMVLMDQALDLPIVKRLSICMDIADGMQYLHNRSPPIIHRDLKSHNIFISEPSPGHFVAKIGDWGSARAVALTGAKNMTHGVGTACWLSPEVINNAHFSKFSDVYAFGIILWEVYTRQEIYEGLSAAQIIAKVANEGLRPHVPRDCPWSRIMTDCWKQDPVGRPNFQTILVALSKIYLKLNSSVLRSKGIPHNISSGGSLNNGDDEGDSNQGEMQPLLAVAPILEGDPTPAAKQYDTVHPVTQFALIKPPRSVASNYAPSPTGKAAQRNNLEGFHPSLENIAIKANDVVAEDRKQECINDLYNMLYPLIEESPAHLAPEVAPAFLVTDEAGNLVQSTGTSKENSRTERSFQYSEQAHPADPLDFLFTAHRPPPRVQRNISGGSQSDSDKTKNTDTTQIT